MNRPPTTIAGVVPIVVTPFDRAGAVDLGQFDRQVGFLADTGCAWIGFGFGSEVQRLSFDELGMLVSRALTVGGARLGVVANAEVSSAAAGSEAIGRAADSGAAAVMVRPTALSGLSSDAVADTLAAAAAKGGLPVVVQDAPQNTGADLPADVLARLLFEVPEVVAVKVESPRPAVKIKAISERINNGPPNAGRTTQASILGGIGGQDFFHELGSGASGTMPGPAVPEPFAEVQRRHATGDDAGAFQIWSRMLPLINYSLRDPETFLATQKYLLTRRGVLSCTDLRQPHSPIDGDLTTDLDRLIDYVGLWELIDECRLE